MIDLHEGFLSGMSVWLIDWPKSDWLNERIADMAPNHPRVSPISFVLLLSFFPSFLSFFLSFFLSSSFSSSSSSSASSSASSSSSSCSSWLVLFTELLLLRPNSSLSYIFFEPNLACRTSTLSYFFCEEILCNCWSLQENKPLASNHSRFCWREHAPVRTLSLLNVTAFQAVKAPNGSTRCVQIARAHMSCVCCVKHASRGHAATWWCLSQMTL